MHTTATVNATVTSTLSAASATANGLQKPLRARAASLVMAAVLTLAMLVGVNTLATGDTAAAPQMAQTSTPRA